MSRTVEAEDLLVDVGEFPFELTSEELATACRRAYLRVIVGAHNGWGKVELARWLAGPYRRLTLHDWTATESEAVIGLKSSGAPDSIDLARRPPLAERTSTNVARPSGFDLTPIPPSGVSVSESRVGTLLTDMRTDVLLVLRELMTAPGRSAFTTLAMDIHLVTQTLDASGASVIVPQARERMSLVDRVLSLVAVDAIRRSEDFEHSLFVCERCEQPVFDIHARPYGMCRIHVSGVTTK
jgi:hypothetical protein